MADGVTVETLASLFDCTARTIQELAKQGIIVKLGRGRYNAALSTRNYVRHLREIAAGRAGQDSAEVSTEDDARSAVALIRSILREEGAPYGGPLQPSMAKNAETILKARARHLKMMEESGRLVDAGTVHKQVFALARSERDSLMNWPARVAPLMAAELDIDPVKLAVALEKHVRDHLAERAEPDLRLAS